MHRLAIEISAGTASETAAGSVSPEMLEARHKRSSTKISAGKGKIRIIVNAQDKAAMKSAAKSAMDLIGLSLKINESAGKN